VRLGSPFTVLTLLGALALTISCSGGSSEESPGTLTTTGTTSPETVAQGIARPLHLPSVAGARCPASRGRKLSTPTASGVALGDGPVRILVNNPGDLSRGRVQLASTEVPGWLALKTHFFSGPSYQGPFLVRAERLDRPGPVSLGSAPGEQQQLFMPAGPAANGLDGWREFPSSTFVKAPGCYGLQVDGLMFSEVIVIHMLPRFRS